MCQVCEQCLTAFQDIPEGGFVVIRVPGIRNIPRMICVIEKEGQFGTVRKQPPQIIHVLTVHTDDAVGVLFFRCCNVMGIMPFKGDPALFQDPFCRGIDIIPGLFIRRCSRGYPEMILKTCFVYKILHDVLCHGTAAYTPVADKQYGYLVSHQFSGFRPIPFHHTCFPQEVLSGTVPFFPGTVL